jgi:hypothetical protein
MSGTITAMDLPEHWQPSSDERILAWVGTLATLTAAALWMRSARTRARRPVTRDDGRTGSESVLPPR